MEQLEYIETNQEEIKTEAGYEETKKRENMNTTSRRTNTGKIVELQYTM